MFIVFHVLHSALYFLLFSENELSIDGKKKELKKEVEINKNGVKNAKREREKRTELLIPLESLSHIRHTHRD